MRITFSVSVTNQLTQINSILLSPAGTLEAIHWSQIKNSVPKHWVLRLQWELRASQCFLLQKQPPQSRISHTHTQHWAQDAEQHLDIETCNMIPQWRSPCFPLASWTAEFFWRRLSAETSTTCSSARLMGEYPISLQPQNSPKSRAWIFDERCVGWLITKRHLFPIATTGQPSLCLSSGNQKQMFHRWKGSFRRMTDTTVMHVWKISSAARWERIGIQNLIQTWDTLVF